MKKRHRRPLASAPARLILAVALWPAVSRAAATTVYVAPGGDDRHAGTLENPLATLEQARDVVRERRGVRNKGAGLSPRPPCTIYLRGGTYTRQRTFELDERDSHTTYAAYPGEKVRLIGGRAIPATAATLVRDPAVLERMVEEAARPHIRRIELKALGITRYGDLGPRGFRRAYIPAPLELFIDGKVQQVARWPNDGSIQLGTVHQAGSKPRDGDYGMKPGIFRWGHDRPAQWTHADDLYLSGVFFYAWADDTIPITTVDPEARTFTTALPHIYGFGRKPFTRWYALNLLEEIDRPGEYYIDRARGMLYFYPPKTFSETSTIEVSELAEPLVAMEGAEAVRLEGITLEIARGTGVYMERGRSNTVAGCTFRNLGILAVQIGKGITPFPYGKHDGCGNVEGVDPKPLSRAMGNWHEYIYQYTAFNREAGEGHRILSCDIYDIGAGGISLSGGDRKTLTPGNNQVENCDIYRVNRWDRTYKTHVNIDGVGNVIRHCHLHHSESGAIYLHGNDHVMEFNEIDHVLTASSDMGAFYMGRDISMVGSHIRYNYFHDIQRVGAGAHVVAVYFDDGSIFGADVIGNVFYNVDAFLINGGGWVETRNNLFVDAPAKPYGRYGDTARVLDMFHGEYQARVTEHVNITEPPYSTRYPELLAVYNRERPVTYEPVNNIIIQGSGYQQLEDFSARDFALKPDAKVLGENPDFEPIPFSRIGLRADAYRTSLPAPPPSFATARRGFLGSMEIALRVSARSAGVVYTVDESEPTLASARYQGPIRVARDTVIRARSIGLGAHPALSDTVSAAFTALAAGPVDRAQINFQTNAVAVPAGWSADCGEVFAARDRDMAYGWNIDMTDASRVRGKNRDPLLDTLIHFKAGAAWEIAVENGEYAVTVCIGDSEYHAENQTLDLEGRSFCSAMDVGANEFKQVEGRVTVADGLLTLTSNHAPHGPQVARINWLQLRRIDGSRASDPSTGEPTP